jgi:hypothetical protein
VTARFSDNFESGNLNAWSGRTGNVTNLASTVLDGARLFRATGNNAYLTRSLSPAMGTVHASVKLSPQTLSTGNNAGNWVTVLELRDGSSQVAAVQYHRQGANGARQVRLVALSGSTTLTSSAVTLSPTAATTLRVDWTAGSAGSAALSVNGTVVRSLNVNATGHSASNVRLGFIGNGASGQLFFDSFVLN